MTGHVHVVAGDLRGLACDAWLLPTDDVFRVSGAFSSALDLPANSRIPGLEWGGRRVVPWREEQTPRIWLADVGRSGAEPGWYAEVIGPFAEGVRQHHPADVGGRRPLLGVNVLGTGEGGMKADKGAIHEALFPALYDAAARYDVDLALVCWGRRAYSAAQRVRRRLLEHDHHNSLHDLWDLGSRQNELVGLARKLGEEVRNQNLVLFMGAGVSAGAGVPAWQGLLDQIWRSLGQDEPPLEMLHRRDVRDQATILEHLLGTQGRTLQKALEDCTNVGMYALTHAQLASLRVKETVTTNFDLLFEAAVKAIPDDHLAVLPYQPVAPGQRWLLKLHGSIDQGDSVVLTRADYLTIPARHGALFGLVQAMLLTRHMLFVGYSMSDEDFHQLVHEVRMARANTVDAVPVGTALALFADPLFEELWAEDLRVVALADPPTGEIPSEEELSIASRRLQILLDLVAFEAADLDSFFLDPSYGNLLEPHEKALVDLLQPLLDNGLVADDLKDNPAALRVRGLLRDLGAAVPDGP